MQRLTLLFLSAILLFSLPATAQITLNQGDIPTAGMALITAGSDTTGVTPGNAGTNQTWDFSFLDTLTIDTTNYLMPSEAPNNEDFPTANLVSFNEGAYFFNNVTSTELWGLGGSFFFEETAGFVSIEFDPMSKQLVFPTTYGTTFTDSTNLDFIIESEMGSFRSKSVLLSEHEVDGYGTVITPVGSFDALRMVTTTNSIDSSWFDLGGGNWFLASSGTSTDMSYQYLAEESHGPMVSLEYLEDGTLVSVTYWIGNITEPQAPVATFSFTDEGGGTIQFSDNSLNDPTSWLWDFGDGNTSTQQNPSYTYASGGTYEVCLTATNSIGSNTTCLTVTPAFAPTAAFTFSNFGGSTINFEDQSTSNPTSWLWDFGDGNTSTLQNPDHTYATAGTYTVCLTVTNSEGSDTVCQSVSVTAAPTAAFIFADQGGGVVAFTDQSTNNPTSWLWDFGDGNTSTLQNPTHTFVPDANYTVCLTVTNTAGADITCQTVAFTAQPVAAFSYTDNGGGNISFQDMSTNSPTSWMWDFGDGNTSTEQNPSHTYTAGGTYNVCLVVTNDLGTDFTCQFVDIFFAPAAAFSFENIGGGFVGFTDESTNNPTSWLWDFGDGNTSTEQDPDHQYAEPGTYTVCLTATNGAGSDIVCQDVAVAFSPVAAFSFSDNGDGSVTFQDLSVFGPTSWLWDFGDGNTSTEQNPTHTYTTSGTYTVCLTATNDQGSNTFCFEISVVVNSIYDHAADFDVSIFPNPATDMVNLSLLNNNEALKFRVMDSQGKVVYLETISNDVAISVAEWPEGLYYFQLISNDGASYVSGKMMVAR